MNDSGDPDITSHGAITHFRRTMSNARFLSQFPFQHYLLQQKESIKICYQTLTHFGSQCKPGLYRGIFKDSTITAPSLHDSISVHTLMFHRHGVAYITRPAHAGLTDKQMATLILEKWSQTCLCRKRRENTTNKFSKEKILPTECGMKLGKHYQTNVLIRETLPLKCDIELENHKTVKL